MNNKGFMMAEVIVVSAVILVTLVGLYTSYNKIFSLYNQRVDYYDVTTLYELANIRDNYLYPGNVGEKKVDGGKTIYYVNKNSIKDKTIDTDGLKPTFKDYLDYLATSLDFNSMIFGEKIIKNILIMENCSDKNNCKYAYLEVIDEEAVLVPKCSLSVSGTTITASVNREDSISYIGWDTNRINNNGIMTTTIDHIGTYTFSVEDSDGNIGTCSALVESTIESKECPSTHPNWNSSSGKCYYDKTDGRTCKCTDFEGQTASFTGTQVTLNSSNCNSACASASGIDSPYQSEVVCSSGYLVTVNSVYRCRIETSRVSTYDCSSKEYTKINKNYCYKIN